mgnify:CR=1 FL=1
MARRGQDVKCFIPVRSPVRRGQRLDRVRGGPGTKEENGVVGAAGDGDIVGGHHIDRGSGAQKGGVQGLNVRVKGRGSEVCLGKEEFVCAGTDAFIAGGLLKPDVCVDHPAIRQKNIQGIAVIGQVADPKVCLLYTSDAADD